MKFIVNEHSIEATLTSGIVPISSFEDQGFQPTELLVASIASCTGFVLQSILKKQRMEVDKLTIEADVVQNKKEANRIEKVTLLFTVKGKELSEEKLEKNLELTQKHCTVVRSVERSIEIDKKLVIEND